MENEPLRRYLSLADRFLNRDMSASEFEVEFLSQFKNEPDFLPPKVFRILDALFASVDAFCPDPTLRNNASIDEEQLRDKVSEASSQLRKLGSI